MRLLARIRAIFPLSSIIPGVITGQSVYQCTANILAWWLIPFVCLVLLCTSFRLRSIAVASLALGFASAIEISRTNSELQSDRTYYATVIRDPLRPAPGAVRLELDIWDNEATKSVRTLCRAVDLPWKNASYLRAGDVFLLRARFMPVSPSLNPFSYDSMLRRHGTDYTCKIRFASAAIISYPSLISSIRERLRRFVGRRLGEGEASGLLLAMSVGARNLLSEETEQAFKTTGLSHLLVASGYQVSLVFLLVAGVVRVLMRYAPQAQGFNSWRLLSMSIGFVAAAAFVGLVGVEGSIIRALFAALFLVFGAFSGRGGHPFNSVLFAFLALIICWPGCFFEPGVQLTFTALCGLSLAPPGKSFVWRYLVACTMACVATGAVAVLWFGRFSLWSFFLNPLLAPLGSVIGCALGLLATLLCVCGIDRFGLGMSLVSSALELFRDIVIELSKIPLMSFEVNGAWRALLAISLLAIFAECVRRRLLHFVRAYSLRG